MTDYLRWSIETQNSSQKSINYIKEDVYSSVLSSRLSSQTHLFEDWQANLN